MAKTNGWLVALPDFVVSAPPFLQIYTHLKLK